MRGFINRSLWIAHYKDFIRYKHKYLTADNIKHGKKKKEKKKREKKKKKKKKGKSAVVKSKTNSNIIQHETVRLQKTMG